MTAPITAIRVASLSAISSAIATTFGVTPKDLQGESRRQEFLLPRQVAIYLARSKARYGLNPISRHFQHSRATVLHSARKIDRLCRTNPAFEKHLERLWSGILSGEMPAGSGMGLEGRLADLERTLRTIQGLTTAALRAVASLRAEADVLQQDIRRKAKVVG